MSGSVQWLFMCSLQIHGRQAVDYGSVKMDNTAYSGFVKEHAYTSSWGKADKVGV